MIVVLILDVMPVVGVDGVTDVIDGRSVDDLVVLSVDGVELDISVNCEMCVVGSDVDELNDVHCELVVVVGHVANVNDVEEDVIEQVIVQLNHDVWNLNVVNLLEDDYGVVDAVNLRCVTC